MRQGQPPHRRAVPPRGELAIGTGNTTGVFYEIGAGYAYVISRNLPGSEAVATPTAGPKTSPVALADGDGALLPDRLRRFYAVPVTPGRRILAHPSRAQVFRAPVRRWSGGRWPAGALALFGLVLAGCTAAPQPVAQPTASSSASVVASPSPVPSARDVTLAVAGDVHFTGRTAALLKNPATAFGAISGVLSAADLTLLNLETAITTRGTEQPKEFHFRAPATALDALRAAGVDLVTLANNHVLDYGQVGLSDTLAALRSADFPYVGIGVNADAAWAPRIMAVGGTRIAVIGVSQVHALADTWVATGTRPGEANAIDEARTLAAIRAARARADVVIVFMHWGTEGNACPNSEQKSLAEKMSAAGAGIVLGAHAHVLQGSGWLGNTFVAYGMGNFLWYGTSHSTQTGVLRLTLHPSAPVSAEFLPAVVSGTGQPVLLTGAAKSSAARRYADLRGCAGLSAVPSPATSPSPAASG